MGVFRKVSALLAAVLFSMLFVGGFCAGRFLARCIDLAQEAHVGAVANSDLFGETVDGLRPFANAFVEFEQ